MSFDLLQNEQIQLGYEHGLTQRQVKLYAKRKNNFLKMEQLRLACESGIAWRDCKRIARMCRSDTEMKQYRVQLEHHLPVRWKRPWKAIIVTSVLLCMISGRQYHQYYEKNAPFLTLSQQEISLMKGEVFQPLAYIESYSQNSGTLILPNIDTEKTGSQIAVYTLETNRGTITELLQVNIVD